jgi:hypothetical protein
MQRDVVIFICSLTIGAGLELSLTGCAMHSAGRSEKRADEHAARAAAVDWLHRVDAGDYKEAFEFEAQDFRMYRTQDQFVRFMQAQRAPFGRARSRICIGQAHFEKLVGLPEGDYETVLFKTGFEHKSTTAERLILIRQAVGWRVVNYQIY